MSYNCINNVCSVIDKTSKKFNKPPYLGCKITVENTPNSE